MGRRPAAANSQRKRALSRGSTTASGSTRDEEEQHDEESQEEEAQEEEEEDEQDASETDNHDAQNLDGDPLSSDDDDDRESDVPHQCDTDAAPVSRKPSANALVAVGQDNASPGYTFGYDDWLKVLDTRASTRTNAAVASASGCRIVLLQAPSSSDCVCILIL